MSASRATAAAVLMVATVSPALAQGGNDFATRCKQWFDKKGYSVDYIEHKTGKRQPGFAPRWKGNVATAEVQAGDVVISSIPGGFGGGGERVGYVEEVAKGSDGAPAAVFVTEWNSGRRFLDRECNVTDEFGQVSSKTRIPMATVLRVWRPSLPLE